MLGDATPPEEVIEYLQNMRIGLDGMSCTIPDDGVDLTFANDNSRIAYRTKQALAEHVEKLEQIDRDFDDTVEQLKEVIGVAIEEQREREVES